MNRFVRLSNIDLDIFLIIFIFDNLVDHIWYVINILHYILTFFVFHFSLNFIIRIIFFDFYLFFWKSLQKSFLDLFIISVIYEITIWSRLNYRYEYCVPNLSKSTLFFLILHHVSFIGCSWKQMIVIYFDLWSRIKFDL